MFGLVRWLMSRQFCLGAAPQPHRVDQHIVLEVEHHELEKVSGSVRSRREVARRIVIKFGPGDGVLDVGIRDLLPTCRAMDLHPG